MPYSREEAAYPLRRRCAARKYWSPVGRVDNVWGDRNLSCSVPAAGQLRGLTTSAARSGTAYACGAGIATRRTSSPCRTPPNRSTVFSHVKPADTPWRSGGLRDFFLYKDLGIEEATARHGASPSSSRPTWHRRRARAGTVTRREFHIVLMLKGWARFMYGDEETLVAAGDCVHQRPGHRALPVRLLARHGVPRGRRPGRLHDRSTCRRRPRCPIRRLAGRGKGRLSAPGLRTPCRARRCRRARRLAAAIHSLHLRHRHDRLAVAAQARRRAATS